VVLLGDILIGDPDLSPVLASSEGL
jgi:hypothetical protein